MSDPCSEFVSRLDSQGFEPRETGPDTWDARCPGHDGTRRNLTIKRADDGRVLVCCHHEPSCDFQRIVQSLGLKMRDLASGGRTNGTHKSPVPSTKNRPGFVTPESAVQWLKDKTSRKKQPAVSATKFWPYTDEAGTPVMAIIRLSFVDGTKDYRPLHKTSEGWRFGDPPGKLPLYRLKELGAADLVVLTEGEKCADLAVELGCVATTTAHGAQSPHKSDFAPLAGKRVVILPDHDEPGRLYADKVVAQLVKLKPPARIQVLRLDQIWMTDAPIPEGADLAEWLPVGTPNDFSREQCSTQLKKFIQDAPTWSPPPPKQESRVGEPRESTRQYQRRNNDDADEKHSAKKELIALGSQLHLFHTPEKTAYAGIRKATETGEHTEYLKLKSEAFRDWLTREYYREYDDAPSSEALSAALNVLNAQAQYDGDERQVHIRVASAPDGCFLIDLADKSGRVVQIGPDGWRVLDESPVPLVRVPGMLAQSEPEAGMPINALREFLNLANDDDWLLIVAWLTAAFRPTGPYAVLVLQGEQGSGKTGMTKVLRRLVDPHKVEIRGLPKDEDTLLIWATRSWVVVIDNLSTLQSWLPDALCRVATGGGSAKRKLYTEDDETFFECQRPTILNGINAPTHRPDLADRFLLINLPPIPKDRRKTEAEFWEQFAAQRPGIFGALLQLASDALRFLPNVRLTELPRMADFARWGAAVAKALGLPEGAFEQAYDRNRGQMTEAAAESSSLTLAVLEFMRDRQTWKGTTVELLAALHCVGGSQSNDDDAFSLRTPRNARVDNLLPKNPKQLTEELKRQVPVLRAKGILAERGRDTSQGLPWILTRKGAAVPVADFHNSQQARNRHAQNPTNSGTVPVVPVVPDASPRSQAPGRERWIA